MANQSLKQDIAAARLAYNIGCCYLKMADKGTAIHWFEVARGHAQMDLELNTRIQSKLEELDHLSR